MTIKVLQREAHCDIPDSDEYSGLLKKIFAARGVNIVEELNRTTSKLLSYNLLKDIDKSTDVLYNAVTNGLKILIVGDFDTDGATSTALMLSMLEKLGAKSVNYIIPSRFEHGYGLSVELVDVILQKHAPELVITVDNGISNVEGVQKLKENGVSVLITDHHLYEGELPKADAIVNPNQPGCEFPSKNLAGVGVVFYVLAALRRRLHDKDWFKDNCIEVPSMLNQLDLVALGTVADVVQLDENNRLLVHLGLDIIRTRKCRVGISALLAIGRRDQNQILASDLSYCVGPRLNAAGRLSDMSLGVRCLITTNPIEADSYADKLNNLNIERRQIEIDMQEQADGYLGTLHLDEALPSGICLFNENWHQGVIGILASRVKEKYHRPTVIFTVDKDGTRLKGSCRSLAKLNIRDVLCQISLQHPGVIIQFGGHAMAAGLVIHKDKLDAFTQAFNHAVSEKLTLDDLNSSVITDGTIHPDYITIDFAKTLNRSGPWGQGFPEPIFENRFHIADQRIVGSSHLKLILEIDEFTTVNAIYFNVDTEKWPNSDCTSARFIFKLDINEFRGRQQVQLIIEHIDQEKIVEG